MFLVIPLVGSVRGGNLSNISGLFAARTRASSVPTYERTNPDGSLGIPSRAGATLRARSPGRRPGELQKGLSCGISSIDADFNARVCYTSSTQKLLTKQIGDEHNADHIIVLSPETSFHYAVVFIATGNNYVYEGRELYRHSDIPTDQI